MTFKNNNHFLFSLSVIHCFRFFVFLCYFKFANILSSFTQSPRSKARRTNDHKCKRRSVLQQRGNKVASPFYKHTRTCNAIDNTDKLAMSWRRQSSSPAHHDAQNFWCVRFHLSLFTHTQRLSKVHAPDVQLVFTPCIVCFKDFLSKTRVSSSVAEK